MIAQVRTSFQNRKNIDINAILSLQHLILYKNDLKSSRQNRRRSRRRRCLTGMKLTNVSAKIGGGNEGRKEVRKDGCTEVEVAGVGRKKYGSGHRGEHGWREEKC